jgi:hypothetical protein
MSHVSIQKRFESIDHLGKISCKNWSTFLLKKTISKRFVKKQQMRWTKVGAHNLLQVRTQVLNDDFYQLFCKWYPGMVEPSVPSKREKAA